MPDKVIDVVGIGNAIVDVIAHCDEVFINRMNLNKGAMTLIDTARANTLYDAMGPAVEISGGSGANTTVGVASLGGKAAFIGKVGNDQLGGIFRHDIRAVGVQFDIPPANSGTPTARSMILVTPDAERTMNTYLGACQELTPADVDPHLIQRAKVTYMEGYLWDPPLAKEAFLKAARIAHDAGQEVSLTLSDSFCVQRYLAEFQDLVKNHVDILFANTSEILALWQTDDWDEAVRQTRQHCDLAALTRSEKGSVIVTADEVHEIPAWPVDKVVDLTGAGDLYAAGFLYGYTHGRDYAACGRIASLAAGEVISHVGARPETPLAELVLQRLR
ncbi:MAG TPA: adenosine kinase [Alphaproteobacteria bacterium]|nr:adenosine kinase [Alphaproteobacteria bacterium]